MLRRRFTAAEIKVQMVGCCDLNIRASFHPPMHFFLFWAPHNLRPIAAISKYIAYFEKNWHFNNSYPIAMWNVSSAVEYEEPIRKKQCIGGWKQWDLLGCLSHSIQPSGLLLKVF